MKYCSEKGCEQFGEIEVVPGTHRLVVERTRTGELISMRCHNDYRQTHNPPLCYFHAKQAAGLFYTNTDKRMTTGSQFSRG
jgi:hypothetical protein